MNVREQLAEALAGHSVLYGVDHNARCIGCGWVGTDTSGESARHLADVITPLVEQIATERAASELREAALDPERLQVLMHGVVPTYVIPQGRLFARADALTARAAVLRSQSHTDKGDQA